MAETLAYDIIARDVNASRTFDHVGDAIKDSAKQSKVFTGEQKALSKQIADTENHLKGLIRQIDGTENKELFRSIRKDQSLLSFLKRAQKQLADGGTEGGRSFVSGFGDALSGLPAQLKGAGIVGAVAIAPFIAAPIGAAIGGAVLGGLGAGGIIGGVIAAAKDDRVANAAEDVADSFSAGFKDAGRYFINPLVDNMFRLQNATDAVMSDLTSGFKALAPLVGPVAKGLEGMARNLNLDKAFGNAAPAIRAIANELPEIGSAISDALDSIGEGSDGATEGLLTVLHATEDLIRFTGEFIRVSSNVYEWLVRNGHAMTEFGLKAMDAFGWVEFIPGAGQAFEAYRSHLEGLNNETGDLIKGLDDAKNSGNDWSGSLADQAENAADAEEKTKAYKEGLEKLFGVLMSQDEAQIKLKQTTADTFKELEKGKRTLDINTQAGRDNATAVLDQVKAIEGLREANISNGMSIEDANKIYEGQIRQLERTLIKLGFNKDSVHALIDEYLHLDKTKATPKVDDKAVTTARGHVDELNKKLERLDGKTTTVYVRTVFGEYRAGERNPDGRASGGGVEAGPMYWVGENGPELVQFGRSGHVYPAGQSRAMAAAGAGTTTMPELNINVRVTGSADEETKRQFLKNLRVDSGFKGSVRKELA